MTLRDIDGQILDWAQTGSDWLHSYTGLDCLEQARVLKVVTSVLWILQIAWQENNQHTFDWMAGLVLLSQVRSIFFGDSDSEAATTNARTGTRNPKRISPVHFIFRCLFLCATLTYMGLNIVAFALILKRYPRIVISLLLSITSVQQLLDACDVQTPREGKIREALQAMGFRAKRLTLQG